MGVHPSQRRVSCEICRKHKSQCRRLHVNDLRCTRCMLLGVECIFGLQKKVGRPRRALASDDKVTKQPPNRSVSTFNTACTTPAIGEYNQVESPGQLHEASSSLDRGSQLDWSDSVSPTVSQEPVLDTPLTMGMDFLDQAPLPWKLTNGVNEMFSSSDADSSFSFTILPSALDLPVTTSCPPDCTYPAGIEIRASSRQRHISTTENITVASDALAKLSKLNIDLHIRMAAVELNKSTLDFNSFIYQNGALHIDDTTLAEFLLKSSQEFLHILTQLLGSRSTPSHLHALRTTDTTIPILLPQPSSPYYDNHCLLPSPSSSSGSSHISQPPLIAPIALTITSIFIQLISLYELTLDHLTARIERIAIDPISPIPNLSSGGLPVVEPCIQGMLFSEVVVHLLERIERLLGIGPTLASGDRGLLSANQRDILCSELSESQGTFPSHGVMRSANVKTMFRKVAVTLKQISIDEQN